MNTIAALHHILLPKRSNNFRAKLLHNSSLIITTLLLVGANIITRHLESPEVGVLGYAANIAPERVVELTNEKRATVGSGMLKLNASLSEAAKRKAADMLAHDYWAHVSPLGVEPWDFFKEVGYAYRFAGENLARDFNSPAAAIEAWMASPSHKENMLSAKYTEIGVAVLEGDLNGKDTTLIVQLFGTPSGGAPSVPIVSAESEVLEDAVPAAQAQALIETPEVEELPALEPVVLARKFDIMKPLTIGVAFVMFAVLLVDVIVVSRRGVRRTGGRAFAHLSFMAMVFIILILVKAGEII